jgi:hypothetical protein
MRQTLILRIAAEAIGHPLLSAHPWSGSSLLAGKLADDRRRMPAFDRRDVAHYSIAFLANPDSSLANSKHLRQPLFLRCVLCPPNNVSKVRWKRLSLGYIGNEL